MAQQRGEKQKITEQGRTGQGPVLQKKIEETEQGRNDENRKDYERRKRVKQN